MWHQLWIPVLIPTLIIKSNCVDNNNTDTVFIRSGGHAEVERTYQERTSIKKTTEGTTVAAGITSVHAKETEPSTTTKFYEEATDGVVFVPNDAPPRYEYEYDGRGLRVKDIMMMKSVHDAMDKNFHVEKNSESPNEDIVFVQGKNNDFEKTEPEDKTRRMNNNNYQNYNRMEDEEDKIIAKPKLNCHNLNCNNTINSVCGAKLISNEWRYRIFLNDCYFRKVNCGFKYEINRYKEVELDRCKHIGGHFAERPFSYKPRPYMYKPELNQQDTRRSFSSRRSMAMNINGVFCSHPCPATCTEDYDPQCAISSTGQKRVFLNHCKLDLNSCSYGAVWQKRPLSDCVGGKKADLRENRGFIGWMQRVGIVDNRGRLVLE